ncbi:MAG TPA: sugar phosphate isomerase/epimerase family protein [Candidatus Acidoferrales bacterium]|nr:sugar phosphate isomerase/epimerase family protein [Candidatus Acidoferrales bacterium]
MIETSGYRFGVSQFTTTPWPFERDVERYAAHGVDAIEICEFKLDANDYARQLRRVARYGLTVSSVQTRVHALFPDSLAPQPSDPAQRLDLMLGAIDRIAPLVPAGTPFVVITGAAPDGNCEAVYQYALRALERLAERAHSYSMRIAFEPLNPVLFHTDTALWGLDAGLELVERVGHEALGLCCDTWNVFRTPEIDAVIRSCGERIFIVQVSDWRRPRNNADRRSLGDGVIPTTELITSIRAGGYDGPYVLEIFSSTSLGDSLWNSDLDLVLDENITAFDRLWNESVVNA